VVGTGIVVRQDVATLRMFAAARVVRRIAAGRSLRRGALGGGCEASDSAAWRR
jgi:hypothetical protein